MTIVYRHYLFALLAYSLIYVIFFSPVLFGGGQLFYSDGSLSDFYSSAQLWSNEYFAGHPVFAAPEKQYSYPLRYLFSSLPQAVSYNIFVLSGFVLTAWFTYGYCYRLSQSSFASFAGGLIFGLSGYMLINVDHLSMIQATAWMPLLLWSLHQLRETLSRWWFAVCLLATSMSILSGHPQITFYTMLFAGCYVLVLANGASAGVIRYCGLCLIAVLLGLGLSAIEVAPMVELGQSSTKQSMSYEVFSSYAFPASQLAQLFFPFIYGGPVESIYGGPFYGLAHSRGIIGSIGFLAIMLAVYGGIKHVKGDINCRFWLGALIVAFILSLGDSTLLFKWAFEVPVFNLFRAHGRLMMIVALAIAVLATLGLAALQRQPMALASRLVIVVGLVALVLGLLQWTIDGDLYQRYGGNLTTLALAIPLVFLGLSSLILLLWRKPLQNRGLKLALLVFLTLDLSSSGWYFPWHYLTVPVDFLQPSNHHVAYKKALDEGNHRFAAMDGFWSKVLTPSQARIHGIATVNGYGPLQMTQYQRFSEITNSGNFSAQLFETQNRTLDLLSVSLVSSAKPIDNADGRFELIGQVGNSSVYRNKRVLPRAWMVEQAIVQDIPTMLATIRTSRLPDGRVFDPLTMALVEQPIELANSAINNAQDQSQNKPPVKPQVTIVTLTNHKIELHTDSQQAAFLVLSENHAAGWQASINGEQHPIVRTNVSLRGLVLPSGKHKVLLAYQPRSLWLGALISLLSLLLCLLVIIYGKNKGLMS